MSITSRVTQVPLQHIETGDRLRQVDPDFVDLIAVSMEQHGLLTPIEVGEGDAQGVQRLIAGAHRVAAARKLGWTHIDARVFTGDALSAELREIDENLCRHELSDLDRATFLARRKAIYEQLHPEVRHGGKRGAKASRQIGDLTARFSAEAAEKLGLSERTVQRLIRRHERLHPEVRRALAGTAFARNGGDLDALAAMPHAEQLRVLQLIQSRGITRVTAAIELLHGPRPERDVIAREIMKFNAWIDRMPDEVRSHVRAWAAQSKAKKRGEAA